MSRSGYTDDCNDTGLLWLYRQAVERAIRGMRGQRLIHDLITALDAIPTKRLIDGELEEGGEVCALGCMGKFRNVPMESLDPHDWDELSKTFDIAPSLAREIMYENDEGGLSTETPEQRWIRLRQWAVDNLKVTR